MVHAKQVKIVSDGSIKFTALARKPSGRLDFDPVVRLERLAELLNGIRFECLDHSVADMLNDSIPVDALNPLIAA